MFQFFLLLHVQKNEITPLPHTVIPSKDGIGLTLYNATGKSPTPSFDGVTEWR